MNSFISPNGIYLAIPKIITALVNLLTVYVSRFGKIDLIVLKISLDYSGFTLLISIPYSGISSSY
jgi:hypothetical protein